MLVTRRCAPRFARGLTLVELMVTIALVALMLRMAVPAFSTMLRNTQVRTVAESLQAGLRTAQSEAVSRNRLVVFSLTNGTPALGTAAVANGNSWQVHTIARSDGDGATRAFLHGGKLTDSTSGVAITGIAGVCFSSTGRLVSKDPTGVNGATCVADGSAVTYDVALTGADRPLRVQLAPNGRVRMCDPKRTYSSSQPDGC